mgnify:CR=1 FL=1|jgi:hypothetical protein|tara:strand:- start:42 stop:497 length:456 start_codon:yes stop_codon:yes gene_type:complete
MLIQRLWSMPNHETFKISCVKQILKDELNDEYLDPFPLSQGRFLKIDALELLKKIKSNSVEKIVLDPPYSQRQLKEMYKNIGFSYDMNNSYWAKIKDEVKRVAMLGSLVLSFGWNSNGIGKNRGFKIIKVWLVSHGSMHNDTIITLERKIY